MIVEAFFDYLKSNVQKFYLSAYFYPMIISFFSGLFLYVLFKKYYNKNQESIFKKK